MNRGSKPFCKKVISIASGKGGVGKTLTTVNIAVAAQRLGLRTLVLDGDLGLANVDVVLGLQAKYHLIDVLEGHVGLDEILLTGPLGLRVIPSGSGISRLTELSKVERLRILDGIQSMSETFDLLIIDTGAGISSNVLHLNSVADRILVVTTPEPHAMTDAYAFIKVMNEEYNINTFDLLVNQTRAEGDGEQVAQRIGDVARRFLNAEVSFLGSVPFDPQLQRLVLARRAATEHSTCTIAGQQWNKIAQDLLGDARMHGKPRERDFWREFAYPEREVSSFS